MIKYERPTNHILALLQDQSRAAVAPLGTNMEIRSAESWALEPVAALPIICWFGHQLSNSVANAALRPHLSAAVQRAHRGPQAAQYV